MDTSDLSLDSYLKWFITSAESRLFESQDSDPQLRRHLDSQCPVGQKIELKIGAQVSNWLLLQEISSPSTPFSMWQRTFSEIEL